MQQDEFPQGGQDSRRSQLRKLVLLALLLLLLALVAWATYSYITNRSLKLPRLTGQEEVLPPEYLFSISGPVGADALTRPVGVAVGRNDFVYATDTKADVVRVFNSQGRYQFSFGEIDDGDKKKLGAPAYVVVDEQENVYVSDRALRAIYVFTPAGEYLRKIVPDDEEKAKTFGPLGMGFDADGNLYVTDVGDTRNHRLVVFNPQGKEIKRFGTTGQAGQMSDLPGKFYFPNGIVVPDEIFIGDSDNRRVQVFDKQGVFDRFIRTSGIPRGMVVDTQDRLYVVDALSHSVDVYSLEGEIIVSFGKNGVGPGEFRFANAIALDSEERIYITDRENNQIQVWAWPSDAIVVPGAPETAAGWLACLSPLLLLPLIWLLRRRRKVVVTPDFVDAVIEAGEFDLLRTRRFKLVTTEAIWPEFEGRVEDGTELAELISAEEHSDTDARDLVSRLGVTYDEAALLVVAKRAKRIGTEDVRIASFAAALGVATYNAQRFIEQHGQKR